MAEVAKEKLKDTIKILMQLDEKSLLLIDSGVKLLAARQELEKKTAEKKVG